MLTPYTNISWESYLSDFVDDTPAVSIARNHINTSDKPVSQREIHTTRLVRNLDETQCSLVWDSENPP